MPLVRQLEADGKLEGPELTLLFRTTASYFQEAKGCGGSDPHLIIARMQHNMGTLLDQTTRFKTDSPGWLLVKNCFDGQGNDAHADLNRPVSFLDVLEEEGAGSWNLSNWEWMAIGAVYFVLRSPITRTMLWYLTSRARKDPGAVALAPRLSWKWNLAFRLVPLVGACLAVAGLMTYRLVKVVRQNRKDAATVFHPQMGNFNDADRKLFLLESKEG